MGRKMAQQVQCFHKAWLPESELWNWSLHVVFWPPHAYHGTHTHTVEMQLVFQWLLKVHRVTSIFVSLCHITHIIFSAQFCIILTVVTVFKAYSFSIWVSNTCCSFCLEYRFPDCTSFRCGRPQPKSGKTCTHLSCCRYCFNMFTTLYY